MLLTIHRTNVRIQRDGRVFASWEEFAFDPAPGTIENRPTGFRIVREASEPLQVEVPVGSRLVDSRLVARPQASGLDATSVHHLARRGTEGFYLASPEGPVQTVIFPETEPGGTEVPAATATWGIAFRSIHLSDRYSLLARSSAEGGPVKSTRLLDAAASWPDRAAAGAWLASARSLDNGHALVLGFLAIEVVDLKAIAGKPEGIEFELPRPAEATAFVASWSDPIREGVVKTRPVCRDAKPRQAMLAFAE